MASPVVNLYKLGRLPYVKSLSIQQVLFDRLKARVITQIDGKKALQNNAILPETGFNQDNSLILVEHEPVYTIGLRSSRYDDIYETKLLRELSEHKLKADFFKTNRGGLITFHGPGQLVAYPILYLGDFHRIKNKSLKAYVHRLEETIIDTLARIGLSGAHTVLEYPGVWLNGGRRKIAFVGIACNRYVTMHGISINCNCDLRWFNHIASCGIEDKAITSIHREMLSKSNQYCKMGVGRAALLSTENSRPKLNHNHHLDQPNETLEKNTEVDQVSKTFCDSFSQIFDCNLVEKQPKLDHEIAKLII